MRSQKKKAKNLVPIVYIAALSPTHFPTIIASHQSEEDTSKMKQILFRFLVLFLEKYCKVFL